MREIRTIDRWLADGVRGAWRRLVRCRDHLWLWWRYTLREGLSPPDQANESLAELCSYRILPNTVTRLRCCIPWFRRWRFGVFVFFVPVSQKSRHWTLCWVRWVDDPLELYLVRSAAQGVTPPPPPAPVRTNSRSRPQPVAASSLLESMSSDDWRELLT